MHGYRAWQSTAPFLVQVTRKRAVYHAGVGSIFCGGCGEETVRILLFCPPFRLRFRCSNKLLVVEACQAMFRDRMREMRDGSRLENCGGQASWHGNIQCRSHHLIARLYFFSFNPQISTHHWPIIGPSLVHQLYHDSFTGQNLLPIISFS